MSRHKRSRSDLGTASKTNPFKAPKLGKPQPLPQRGNPSLNRAQTRVKKYENELDNIGNQVHRKRNNRQNNVVRNANKKKQTKVNKQTDVSSLKRANRTHIKRGQSIQRIVVTPKKKDAKSSAGTKASKSQIQSMSRHKRSRSDLGTAYKTNPFKAPKRGKPQALPQRGTPSLNRAQTRVKKYENELDNIGNQVHRKRNNRQNNVVRNANKKKQTKVNKQTDVSSLKRANRTHIKRGQSIQRIVVTPKTKDAKSSAGTKVSKSQIQSMSRHKRSRSDLGTAYKTNPFKAPKRGKPQALPQRGTPSLNRAQTTKNVFATKKTHHKSTSTTFVLGTINPSSMAAPPINQILIHFDHDEQFIEQRKQAFASHNHKVSERVNKYENELDNIGNQVHRVGVNKNYKSDANTNKRQRQKHAKKPLFGRPLSALQETRDAHKSKRTNRPTLQRSTSSKNVHSQPTKTHGNQGIVYKTNTQNTTKSPGNRTRARQFADKVGSRY
eukprot:618355_1